MCHQVFLQTEKGLASAKSIPTKTKHNNGVYYYIYFMSYKHLHHELVLEIYSTQHIPL